MTDLLDAEALAERLHCSKATAQRLISTRTVPVFVHGRIRLVPSDALTRWIAERTEYPRDHAPVEGDGIIG